MFHHTSNGLTIKMNIKLTKWLSKNQLKSKKICKRSSKVIHQLWKLELMKWQSPQSMQMDKNKILLTCIIHKGFIQLLSRISDQKLTMKLRFNLISNTKWTTTTTKVKALLRWLNLQPCWYTSSLFGQFAATSWNGDSTKSWTRKS